MPATLIKQNKVYYVLPCPRCEGFFSQICPLLLSVYAILTSSDDVLVVTVTSDTAHSDPETVYMLKEHIYDSLLSI